MSLPALLVLAACGPPEADPDGAPEPLVLADAYPDHAAAGDAVYIRYDGVPNMVRATPAGVEALDIGARRALWAEPTPDGRFLLVLAEGDAGVEHLLVEDGAVVMAFPGYETNHVSASPDGRHLALWFDGARDPHTDLLVDVTSVTLVDTEAGVATRLATALAPTTVTLGDTTALVLGPGGAVALDLLAQVPGEAYDFAAEGVAGDGWGHWGVLSPEEAWALVSTRDTTEDDTVVRLGLATRSVLTAEAPLSHHSADGYGDERAPRLFRVGDTIFAHTSEVGLATVDPETLAFSLVAPGLQFSDVVVQGRRALLSLTSGEGAAHLLQADPVAIHEAVFDQLHGPVWLGDEHAVTAHFQGGAWYAKVLDLATADTWTQAVQDIPVQGALVTGPDGPVALLEIHEVETYGLWRFLDASPLEAVGRTGESLGAMANDEAFWIHAGYEDGYIGFVDPVTGAQTEYRDFTDLDLMRER